MKKFVFLACFTLSIFIVGGGAGAATLAVVGQSDVEALPDTASITFSVITNSQDAVKAQSANVATTKFLIAKLIEAGVEASNIQISNYYFRRDIRNSEDGKTISAGFDASNTIEAKTSNFALLPKLVAIVVANGGTGVGDATYSLSDEKPTTDKARIVAFNNADEEAKKSAAAAGLQLGPIVKIAVGNATFSNMLEGLGGGMSRNSVQLDSSNLQPDLTVDMVHVQYSVTIEYELR